MKTTILLLLVTTMLTLTVNAQDQSSRFNKQHHSRFVNSSLEQTETMLLEALKSDNPNMQTTAIQTFRDLEIMFPDNKFSSFTEPLILNLKDEKEDIQVRLLSALALENLHSDLGDKAIYDVAVSTSNKSVKDLCMSLSADRYENEDDIVKR